MQRKLKRITIIFERGTVYGKGRNENNHQDKMEYRYTTVAHKMIAIEAGHVCQNLYLAAESIDCGCCAVAGYSQEKVDQLIGVNGEDEFVIYIGVIGKY